MAEPLTIYECPTCGRLSLHDVPCQGINVGTEHPSRERRPIRGFREEDVRPLWTALRLFTRAESQTRAVLDAFPAPADWRP
jgi:hypothetical protein